MAEVDELRRRRLAELEKRAAVEGITCDPAVLIEIADLRKLVAPRRAARGRSLQLDIDLLTACMANALQRITEIEQHAQAAQAAAQRASTVAALVQGLMLAGILLNMLLVVSLTGK